MLDCIKRGGSKIFRVHYKLFKEDKKLKKNNKKGFTLAELLIVVAIIAVLVAISIPVFTAQLEKSREATDLANIRSAYAAAQAAALTGSFGTGTNVTDIVAGTNYYYDAVNGTLSTTNTNWFKGTATGTGTEAMPGNITYDRSKAYTSLTITFTGNEAPYTANFTLE